MTNSLWRNTQTTKSKKLNGLNKETEWMGWDKGTNEQTNERTNEWTNERMEWMQMECMRELNV